MFDLPPPDPAAEIVVASRGISKGVAQTKGPQIIPKASLRFGAVQIGAQWKNVTSTTANGEAALFVNGSRKFGSVLMNGGAAYKFQTGARGPTDSTSWEFSGGLSRKFGAVTARMNAIYSPNDLGQARRSLFVEAGPAVQLPRGWTVSAAIGHRSRQNGVNYTAFNAGVSKTEKALTLDFRYYDTGRSSAGEIYDARFVALAKLSL